MDHRCKVDKLKQVSDLECGVQTFIGVEGISY